MSQQRVDQANAGERLRDDEISLRPYVETLRRYRRVIWGAAFGVSGGFILVVLAALIYYPSERFASVQFRLQFEGAVQNRYPNDAPFSPAEIVSAPVVTEVFRVNDLHQYGTFESFKDSLFIQQSNPELDLLAYEYQAKLTDAKLTPVDRARIEDEFSRKREALNDPVFSLTLRRSERFKLLPRELAQKVLTDTLATWAVQAERMGAMKYQVPILSSKVLSKESLENEDYLVGADLLRAKAVRIIDTIAELERVPGALTIRASKDQVSLPEIRANIEDALRFELEPLLGVIRSEGVTKNARQLTLYASNRLFQLRLEKQVAEDRANAVRDSLQEYMAQRTSGRRADDGRSGSSASGKQWGLETQTMIPQLGETFLNRLVEMSAESQKSDVEFRQKLTDRVIDETTRVAVLEKEFAYYEDLVKSVQGIGNRPAGALELVAIIRARSQNAFSAIARATDQLTDVYAEISAKNLNPVERLFVITGPFTLHSQSALSFRTAFMYYALVLVLTLIVMPAGCLLHDALRRRQAA